MKRISQVSMILALLLVSSMVFTKVAFSSQASDRLAEGTPETPAYLSNGSVPIFLPVIVGRPAVSGRVMDTSNRPVPGVSIVDSTGISALTDINGNYYLKGFTEGSHDLAPDKDGYVFAPSVVTVNLPGESGRQDFTAVTACTNVITNSGFENDTGWVLPVTVKPARYSKSNYHSGAQSVLTGILSSENNLYSYSSTQQLVKIPADASHATLRVWLYPRSEEATTLSLPPRMEGQEFGEEALVGDVQYVLVLDSSDNVLESLLWMRSDDRQWMLHEFNLSRYAGEKIKIHIGTYNDGSGGKTALYVDDATLEICPASEPTPTPVPTTTGTPPACENKVSNSSFESSAGWEIPDTVYDAGYTSGLAHTGSRSMRTGIEKTADNIFSYSDAGQWVTVPKNLANATLKMWIYPVTEEATTLALPRPSLASDFRLQSPGNDVQYVLILDEFEQILDIPLWQLKNNRAWIYQEFNLGKYAGRTIKIQFGTYNTGGGQGVTAMYVDDLILDACPSGVPTATPTITPTPTATVSPSPTPTPTTPSGTTPTATSTPGGCEEGIDNGGFEQTSDWIIPVTEFSAGYSTARAYAGSRSMRTGIVYTVHNRYSYSDAGQVVTIPASADEVLLRLWVYPLSEESTTLSLPAIPQGNIFGKEALANDVQYVIILDRFDNWIDTLLWQRSNAQNWSLQTFDLSDFAGETIKVQFGTYNDGSGGVTAMYVDNASLQICR